MAEFNVDQNFLQNVQHYIQISEGDKYIERVRTYRQFIVHCLPSVGNILSLM